MNASIGDLAWLAGQWRGRYNDNIIEEHWSAPQAGTLMCMFRWIHDDKVRFYELVTVETDEDGQLRQRIKHFNPGLRGWEEKDDSVTFTLESIEGQSATFVRDTADGPMWMVYRRDADLLIAWFERERGIHAPDDEFRYQRVETP